MKTKNKKSAFIILFLLPSVLLFGIIYAYPLVNIFITSFQKWNYKNITNPTFLGFSHMFDNYIRLFTKDYYFMTALINSLKWMALALIIQVPLAIIVALVLSNKPRGWKFTRNAFIIPNIISSAAIGLIFLNLYDPARGAITEIVKFFNPSSNINILANEKMAFWGVSFSFVLFAGTSALLLLAQIFAIPKPLFESAKIDGANQLQTIIYITLPLVKNAIGTISILAANYGLLIYNEIALITAGGPDRATYSISFFIERTALGSSKLNFALANTAGVIQLILGLILVGLITKVFNTGKSYND